MTTTGRIEGAPAVHRGSRCPELVLLMTVLREVVHPSWWEALRELVARVRTEQDRREAHAILLRVRRDPLPFVKPLPKLGARAQSRFDRHVAATRRRRGMRT